MVTKLVVLCAVLLALSTCSGDGDPNPVADSGFLVDGSVVVPDTTAPTVLSITPADGTAGVRSDATVVYEFSEPMDQLSVQNSFDTSKLGGVTFAWSSDGATVTIAPDEPLAYALISLIGEPQSATPKQYSVILATGATDEAGNPLATDAQTTFTTLRQFTTAVGTNSSLTKSATPDGVDGAGVGKPQLNLQVGDDDQAAFAKAHRILITMDLALLPTTAVEIVSSTLTASELAESGDPYGALGKGTGVLIDHGIFTLGNADEVNAAFNLTPLSAVGVFSNSGDTEVNIDVTSQVQDDFANRTARGDLSQYRLSLTEFTNMDKVADSVLIIQTKLSLKVVFLEP